MKKTLSIVAAGLLLSVPFVHAEGNPFIGINVGASKIKVDRNGNSEDSGSKEAFSVKAGYTTNSYRLYGTFGLSNTEPDMISYIGVDFDGFVSNWKISPLVGFGIGYLMADGKFLGDTSIEADISDFLYSAKIGVIYKGDKIDLEAGYKYSFLQGKDEDKNIDGDNLSFIYAGFNYKF
jgi:hypothetical protein